MADSNLDVSALTDDQRSSLDQLIAITNQEPEPALQLLRKCEWNLQIAIARFFDGEPAVDPVAEALAQRPEDMRRQETLMNGFSSPRPRRADPNLEPAPRIVPQNDRQVAYRANPLLGIIFMPVSLVYALLSRAFRLFGYLFPFLPRLFGRIGGTSQGSSSRHNAGGRIALKPKDAALRLIREIEEEYGSNELPFFDNGYAQALDVAKRDLKFLLVVLISQEHDDTASFIRETLLDPTVANYIKDPANNILLWAGTVQDAEAYQVSTALTCTKFPFSAIIVHTPSVSSTAMSIVQRIVGPMPARDYLSKVQRAIEQYSIGLNQTRRTRDEQNASRSLREQQNEAYERSLAQDRERARIKREEEQRKKQEEERIQREEAEKQSYARNLEQWRRWRASTIRPEPGADVKDAVRISLRMLDGERVIRKFAANATMEELYAFVECQDTLQAGELDDEEEVKQPAGFRHEYKFRLVTPMPREAYELDAGGTIKERIGRSGNLIVEKTEMDDSDEEEDEDVEE
jgi:FAS-associated factor 2